eukprot:s3_g24.t1
MACPLQAREVCFAGKCSVSTCEIHPPTVHSAACLRLQLLSRNFAELMRGTARFVEFRRIRAKRESWPEWVAKLGSTLQKPDGLGSHNSCVDPDISRARCIFARCRFAKPGRGRDAIMTGAHVTLVAVKFIQPQKSWLAIIPQFFSWNLILIILQKWSFHVISIATGGIAKRPKWTKLDPGVCTTPPREMSISFAPFTGAQFAVPSLRMARRRSEQFFWRRFAQKSRKSSAGTVICCSRSAGRAAAVADSLGPHIQRLLKLGWLARRKVARRPWLQHCAEKKDGELGSLRRSQIGEVLAMAEAEDVLKDWHDLKCSLGELDGAVARLSNQKTGGAKEEVAKNETKRLPSVFSASCERDLKLLNRCYSPNIFAWDLCSVGVEDDVDDLQLRVAYRLRRRAEELQRSDLEQLRQKQRQEMNEADEFMQGFDSQHWLQNQVAKLPGPNDDLEELLGERFQTPQKAEYHRARGVLGIDEVAWDGKYRATWNPDAMGFPMAICSVQSVAEVQRVVKYAAQHCLPVGVRLCVAAGRHSHMCMLDNTLVLDLQGLSSVEVFPELHLAKVQGGAQQGQLDVACEPHGLATTAGHNASTGCGGLILQGGHGFLEPCQLISFPWERMFGLVIDNLVEVELVLANGELVKANANEHEDLFWAIRGGGGNFGVVVSFTLRPVYAGTQIHAAQAPGEREELLTKFFEKTVNGPDEATGLVVLPCGGPMIEMLVWVGSPSQGQEYFQRRASGPKSYHSDVQRFSDPNGTGKAVYLVSLR